MLSHLSGYKSDKVKIKRKKSNVLKLPLDWLGFSLIWWPFLDCIMHPPPWTCCCFLLYHLRNPTNSPVLGSGIPSSGNHTWSPRPTGPPSEHQHHIYGNHWLKFWHLLYTESSTRGKTGIVQYLSERGKVYTEPCGHLCVSAVHCSVNTCQTDWMSKWILGQPQNIYHELSLRSWMEQWQKHRLLSLAELDWLPIPPLCTVGQVEEVKLGRHRRHAPEALP